MNLSPKPVTASFFFQDPFGILVVKRWWEGVEYLGLPTGELSDGESVEACAWRTIAPNSIAPGSSPDTDIALVNSLGPSSHMGGDEDHEWGGRPVAANVFAFPDARIVAPMTSKATRVSLDEIMGGPDGTSFDVTIDILRQILRKRPKTAAA